MSRSITTVIIDTETYELGYRALTHTVSQFPTDRVLIYSDSPEKWPGFSVKLIPTIRSIEDYDHIVMKDLANDLETDRALIIQYDGFVINADQFSPHFLYYDYIGAPWTNLSQLQVGNGGFSLRSKRLICSAAEYYDQKGSDPEDGFICRVIQSRLETKHGCHFAPIGIAQHFSTEFNFYPWPTFGFHGFVMLPYVYKNELDFLLGSLPRRVFSGGKLRQMSHFFANAPAYHREMFERYIENSKELSTDF